MEKTIFNTLILQLNKYVYSNKYKIYKTIKHLYNQLDDGSSTLSINPNVTASSALMKWSDSILASKKKKTHSIN